MDCVSLYNKTGLISKVFEDISRENVENCRSRQLHCRLTPLPLQGTSANIRKPYTARNWSHWPTFFAADSMGLSSFIFCGGLRNTPIFCNRVCIGRSTSSKVVDFGTNRKDVCDFLLVINSNFGTILHRF